MDKEFIQQRHSAFNASEEAVFDLVKKATGKNPESRQKIVAGFDNEVYSVKAGDSEFIARLSHFGEVDFAQEAWAMEQCRKVGVPVSEVFLVNHVELPGKKLKAMVIGKLPGQPVSLIEKDLSSEQLSEILYQAGEILGRIHSIKVGGFYRRHADGTWDFPNWTSVMNSSIKGRSEERDAILKAGFSDTEFDIMISNLKRYKNDFPDQQPVLCHGDYLLEHIFVDDKLKISGIIDFGAFEGDSPVHDFAYFAFEEPNNDLGALMDGYGNKSLFDDKFTQKLYLHKQALEMGHLAYQTLIGNTGGVKFIAAQLKKTLVALSKI